MSPRLHRSMRACETSTAFMMAANVICLQTFLVIQNLQSSSSILNYNNWCMVRFWKDYGGHSRISDTDLKKPILYNFCASHIMHIPTNKLLHMCYSEHLSNYCLGATSMVARQQKMAMLVTLAATQYFL